MWIAFLIIYLAVLAGVSIMSLFKIDKYDTPAKIISLSLITTAIFEITAHIILFSKGNNLTVYHIFNPIQFIFICLFFTKTTIVFSKRNAGIFLGLVGVLYSIFNSLFVQPASTTFNSNFLVFESIAVIIMSLLFLYEYLKHTTELHIANLNFTYILLLYWSFTFFRWLTKAAMPTFTDENFEWIRYTTWFINFITYLGLGIILYKRPKKNAYG